MRFLSNILAKAGLVVDGTTQLNTIANATVDTDRFLVSDSAIVKYRTGAQVLSDIGAAPAAAGLPVGGTAGQILAKIDATNYNTQWIDNYAPQIQHIVKLGAAMSAGTPVYVSSADGTNMIVSKASNDSEATSTKVLGLIKTGGVLNDQVFVVTEGLLAGIDTSTAQAGDPVWLGVNGAILFGVANKPVAPAHMVFLGVVTRVQASNGEIFVKVQNGFELNELHDVSLPSYVSNGVLYRDTAVNLWKTASIATVLGYTPANDSLVVHIAGTETITGAKTFSSALTLSTIANATIDTDRFLVSDSGVVKYRTGAELLSDIGAQPLLTNPVTGSGTTNYIPKFTGTSAIGNSVIYESGGTIGINATSFISGSVLDVRGGTIVSTNSDLDRITINPASRSTSPAFGMANGSMAIYTVGAGVATPFGIGTFGGAPLIFGTANTERMRLDASGNLLVGTTTLATGFSTYAQIEASGTTGGILINSATNNIGRLMFTNNNASGNEGLIRYDGSNQSMQFWTSANERMRLDASGNLGLGTSSPASKFHLYNGDVTFEANTSNANLVLKGSATNESTIYFLTGSTFKWNIGTSSNDLTFYKFQGGAGEAMRLTSSGNLGLGVTPSAWGSGGKAIQVGTAGAIAGIGSDVHVSDGMYYDGTNWRFLQTGVGVSTYYQTGGTHAWYSSGSGTAGNTVSLTQAMTLFNTGNLALGGTTDNGNRLSITGNAYFSNYVGIGTNAPAVGLHLVNSELRIRNADNNLTHFNYSNGSTNYIRGVTYFDQASVYFTGGNVGIGSTTPNYSGYGASTRVLTILGGAADNYGVIELAAPSVTASNRFGEIRFLNLAATGGVYGFSSLRAIRDGADNSSALTLWTSSAGTSAERMRITSAGNVGIGTTAPFAIANWTTLELSGQATNGGSIIYTGLFGGSVKSHYYTDNTSGAIGTQTNHPFIFTTNNTEKARFTAGGNFLIGTTTDGGYRLDVAGSGRFLQNQNGFTSVVVQNNNLSNGAGQALRFYYDSSTPIGGIFHQYNTTTGAYDLDVKVWSGFSPVSRLFVNGANGNLGLGTSIPTAATANRRTQVIRGTSAELLLQSSNTTDGTSVGITYTAAGNDAYFVNRLDGIFVWTTGGGGNTERMRLTSSGSLGIGGTPNSSAILQADSTTQGFLPPRMTQTQRNAISSPATGLIIFQTDNNAGFYFYNGSAWKALAIVQ